VKKLSSFNYINMKIFCFLLIGIFCLSCSKAQHTPIEFTLRPYFFDAGMKDSEVDKSSILLSPNFLYSDEYGYGWTTKNLEAFNHNEWHESRDDKTIDGLSADKISFKADLPNGDWWITIWFDGGLEDSSTVSLSINGIDHELNLQDFSPSAESEQLREAPQKMYRIVQRKVNVSNSPLTFTLKGGRDLARILSFSLIPDQSEPVTSQQKKVISLLQEKASYDSKDSANTFLDVIKDLPENDENRSFKAFWEQRISIIKEAEKYFYFRGWSWATNKTGLGLFDHLHQSVMLYDAILSPQNAEKLPLYERALWYRARTLYWLKLERGGYNEGNQAEIDLAKIFTMKPNNELVRMYNGAKIDSPDPFDNIAKPLNAPDWAFTEWELMNRLKYIADWWVLEQQSETGEFGGKFGDDVEILRWWSPLILSGDDVAHTGWKKLADGVWNSSKVYKGYAKNPSDVEHSSEFIADTAPLMVLFNDNPEYEKRLAYSSEYFKDLWSGYNSNGDRFFKSAWFSSTEIETEPPKNRDVVYNTRATKAARYYAWKTKDPSSVEALIEWAESWLSISQTEDKGKPLGIIPPSIEFPSGVINGPEKNWYTANMLWDYFNWNGSTAVLDQLLYTWTLTGDDKFLKPFIQHLELVKKYESSLSKSETDFEKGSEEWAAYVVGNNANFWNVVGTWRLLTGDNRYDEIIIERGTPFIKYRLTGNEDFLVEGMEKYLETVRYNYPMLTSEGIHTDRIFIKEGGVREAGILQAMVTGYGIAESSSPYIAVSWEKASRDLTYLVTDSDSSSLDVDLYSFSDSNELVTMRLWQLRSGEYTLAKKVNGKEETQQISIKKGGERFKINVEPKNLTTIHIRKVEGLNE